MQWILDVVRDKEYQRYLIGVVAITLTFLLFVTTPSTDTSLTAASGAAMLFLYSYPVTLSLLRRGRNVSLLITVVYFFLWVFLKRDWTTGAEWLTGALLTYLVLQAILSLVYGVFWQELTD